jgi:hypothetical protein
LIRATVVYWAARADAFKAPVAAGSWGSVPIELHAGIAEELYAGNPLATAQNHFQPTFHNYL